MSKKIANEIAVILISSLPDKGMKSLGHKGLMKLGDMTLIEAQINHILTAYRHAHIYITCSFDAKKIIRAIKNINKNTSISIIEHDLDAETNFGQPLRLALEHIPESKPVIILNTNIIAHTRSLVALKYDRSFILSNTNKAFDTNVGCTYNTSDGLVEYIFYDLEPKICECVYLTPQDRHLLETILCSKTDNQFLFEIINSAIVKDLKLHIQQINTKDVILFNSLTLFRRIEKILQCP